MNIRRIIAPALLASLSAVALAPMATAQSYTVLVSIPEDGDRQVLVEDLLGLNALESVTFGKTRTQAFRLRTVDQLLPVDEVDNFEVTLRMSNLYLNSDPTDAKIASSNVSLGYVTPDPIALSSSVVVDPVLNIVADALATVCATLADPTLTAAVPVDTCSLGTGALEDVGSILSEIPLSLDGVLPFLPQTGDSGPFTNPEYISPFLLDPANAGGAAVTGTELVALTSSGGSALADLGLLSAINDAFVALGPCAIPTDCVTPEMLQAAVIGYIGINPDDVVLPVGSLLTLPTLADLVASLELTLDSFDITHLNGTYLSYPTLKMTVPAGTPAGDFGGRLVVDIAAVSPV